MQVRQSIWDVIVIGGGPAGMMAAAEAARDGAQVLVLEKNAGLGKKLLITGGGRCNITNNKPEVRTMLARYGLSEPFLFSAFAQHGVADTLAFFSSYGLATREENDGRLFPTTNQARTVWDVLVQAMRERGVVVKLRSQVSTLRFDPSTGAGHITVQNQREELVGRSIIVATGGTSHPETGSTGEGLRWLKALGHTIIHNDFALVPITTSDAWAHRVAGVSLNGVKISILADGVRKESHIGRVLFTHVGLSGPTILNLARTIGDMLRYSAVTLHLDLFPKLDAGALRRKLQELLVLESNKKLKNVLAPALIPAALVTPLLEIIGVDGETACHSVSTESRKNIVALLKQLPLTVTGLLGAEKAIISSGGVALEEVNFKTMQSRMLPGLYLVGDVLNINRPSGGYSLQLCWTTGFVAGRNAREGLSDASKTGSAKPLDKNNS